MNNVEDELKSSARNVQIIYVKNVLMEVSTEKE